MLAPVPDTPVKEPAGHVAHAEDPASAANEPCSHSTQALTSVAPGAMLAVPGTQRTHVARSGATYSPATHDTHDVLPAGAAEPDAQTEHEATLVAPGDAEKRPLSHCTHADAAASV